MLVLSGWRLDTLAFIEVNESIYFFYAWAAHGYFGCRCFLPFVEMNNTLTFSVS